MRLPPGLRPVLFGLLVVVLNLAVYGHVLGLWFTGADTFALIDAGRFDSGTGLTGLFTTRLMEDTSFLPAYYRPMTELLFGLDHAVWGLRPFGYHLTDLVLHILVALALFFLLNLLTSTPAAVLGSVLFSTHPLLYEIVPVTARRQDPLMALFVCLSLACYLRSNRRRGAAASVGAGLFMLLALGSKESAVVLLAFFAIFSLLFPPEGTDTFASRLAGTLRQVWPYVLTAVLYFGWRALVLERIIGGTVNVFRDRPVFTSRLTGIWTIATDLFSFLEHGGSGAVSLLLGVGVLGLLGWWLRGGSRPGSAPAAAPRGLPLDRMARVGFWVMAGGILLYPHYSPVVEYPLRLAHENRGFRVVRWLMERPNDVALEVYFQQARRYLMGGALVTLILLGAWLGRGFLDRVLRAPRRVDSETRGGLGLLGCGIVVPGLMVITGEFSQRNLYLAVLLISGSLAIALGKRLRSLRFVSGGGLPPGRNSTRTRSFVALLLMVVLGGWIWFYSPLFHRYRGWDCAGSVASLVTHALAEHSVSPGLSTRGVLVVRGYPPRGVSLPGRTVPSLSYPSTYSLNSWLRLAWGRTPYTKIRLDPGDVFLERCPHSPRHLQWTTASLEEETVATLRWTP